MSATKKATGDDTFVETPTRFNPPPAASLPRHFAGDDCAECKNDPKRPVGTRKPESWVTHRYSLMYPKDEVWACGWCGQMYLRIPRPGLHAGVSR